MLDIKFPSTLQLYVGPRLDTLNVSIEMGLCFPVFFDQCLEIEHVVVVANYELTELYDT
jgi:hypothetical protein